MCIEVAYRIAVFASTKLVDLGEFMRKDIQCVKQSLTFMDHYHPTKVRWQVVSYKNKWHFCAYSAILFDCKPF